MPRNLYIKMTPKATRAPNLFHINDFGKEKGLERELEKGLEKELERELEKGLERG